MLPCVNSTEAWVSLWGTCSQEQEKEWREQVVHDWARILYASLAGDMCRYQLRPWFVLSEPKLKRALGTQLRLGGCRANNAKCKKTDDTYSTNSHFYRTLPNDQRSPAATQVGSGGRPVQRLLGCTHGDDQ
jgi:hypothetical protein